MQNQLKNKRSPIALVFCGGKGTRMQPITSLIRKEMLPVGLQRKPLLAHIVEHLKSYGLRHIIFLGSRKNGGDVANYFGNGRRFGVKATHHPDPAKCRGTGHALLWAIKKLKLKGRELLVYYGDMFNLVDLNKFYETHNRKGTAVTIAVSNDYSLPKGVASVTIGGNITKFEEKPKWQGPGKIAVGLLCINTNLLIKSCGGLPTTVDQLCRSRFIDVMGDIVKHLVRKHEVAAYITKAIWRDIGSFQDYREIQRVSVSKEYKRFISKKRVISPTEPGLSIFLSYHICKENKQIVEKILAPCLNSAGYRVMSGAKLSKTKGSKGTPTKRARELIDVCDVLVSIATPVGKGGKPSDYVSDELSYADREGKGILLFVEKGRGIIIPGPWRDQYRWEPFSRDKIGEFVRDVLELVSKVE